MNIGNNKENLSNREIAYRLGRAPQTVHNEIQRGTVQLKYLNNLIEQDHRKIKRRSKTYKSLRSASATIKGIETIHTLYKKYRRDVNLFGFSALNQVKNLLVA